MKKKRSDNKNKKILVRCLIGAGVVVLLAALLFFIPRKNAWFSLDCFRARAAVSSYLKDIKAENFVEASKSVYFTSEDGTPLPSDDANRQAWISRITELRRGISQNYLLDYSKLSVVKVKGEMKVKVVLDITAQGGVDKVSDAEAVFFLVKDGGDWKISSVSEYEYKKKSQYERALSGILPSEE